MRTLAVLALLLTTTSLHAQCGETVTLGTLGPGAEYGAAVAVDGDTLVVGAPGVDTVQVQTWNGAGWSTIATFAGQAGSRYGAAVALADGIAIVGAPEHDGGGSTDAGAVQLLVEGPPGTWTTGPVVLHPDPQDDGLFGRDVDTDGERAVVGAPGQDGDAGDARVYDVTGGALVFVQRLAPPTGLGSGDVRWGESVAVDGPSAAVGAPNADPNGFVNAGAACFFRTDGAGVYQFDDLWSFDTNFARFGFGVDVDGDRGVGRGLGNFAAALFVEYDGVGQWDAGTTVLLLDADESISLSGNRCLAGRPDFNATLFGPPVGAFAFPTFDGTDWVFPTIAVKSLASPTLRLGDAVSLDGDRGVVGAPGDATAGPNSGAVYTYDTSVVGWLDEFAVNSAIASTAHGTPTLVLDGSFCDDEPLRVVLESAAPTAPATLVVGLSQLAAPFKGGVLGPAPDVLLSGFSTSPGGALTLTSPWPAGLPIGTELWFQWFVVDAATPKGLSATATLKATTPLPAP